MILGDRFFVPGRKRHARFGKENAADINFSLGAGGLSRRSRTCKLSLSFSSSISFSLMILRATETALLITNSVKLVCCNAAARISRDFSSDAIRNDIRSLVSIGILEIGRAHV